MNIKLLSAGLAIVSSLMINTGVAADASCKGMAENSCTGESSCRWVQPYKRTDGSQVNGYCRTLSVKSSTQTVSSVAPQK